FVFFNQYEFGQISMQLVLLVDALILNAIPAFLLGNAQGTGDVIAKIQPLLFCQDVVTFLQVTDGLIIVLQLQVTLAQEEVGLDRLAVQLQCMLTIGQSLVMLLQLHVAESPVGVVHRHRWITVLGDGTNQNMHILCCTGSPAPSAPARWNSSPGCRPFSPPAPRGPPRPASLSCSPSLRHSPWEVRTRRSVRLLQCTCSARPGRIRRRSRCRSKRADV
uniref:Uncharacterized protein n=1 Tax=Scophthalmus maximus TaxID=52904 RepID=A0A8D3ASA1_SCOMX